MIYLDSAAIVKLIRPERESPGLARWLFDRQDEDLVTSTLAEVEVTRAMRRGDPDRLPRVPSVLSWLVQVEMGAAIRATAAAYPDSNLRSLDAIHLATAHTLVLEGKPLTALVTYDRRLRDAAGAAGLPVTAPA